MQHSLKEITHFPYTVSILHFASLNEHDLEGAWPRFRFSSRGLDTLRYSVVLLRPYREIQGQKLKLEVE